MVKRYRSRGGRRRYKRRALAPIYKNPFPDVQRIVHRYQNTQIINPKYESAGTKEPFATKYVYRMNHPGRPIYGTITGPSASAVTSLQAIGFDALAANYQVFYVVDTYVTMTFRLPARAAGETEFGDFRGYVGYMYSEDKDELAAIANRGNEMDDGTADTTTAMRTANANQLWRNAKGLVWRKWDQVDGERGMRLDFKYNRRSFVANKLDQDFDAALGQVTSGTTLVAPTEKALICPFAALIMDPAGTVLAGSNKSYFLVCEVTMTYHVIWSNMYNNGTMPGTDTTTFNVITAPEPDP